MPRRHYLFIPGIHQRPSGNDDWSDRACEWVEDYTDAIACDYEYRCRWWQKTLGQRARIDAAADILNAYADHDRVIAAHSNGAAVALGVLDHYPHLRIEALHLFAAAAPAHYGVNGLNRAVARGQVGRIHLYGSRNDRALWLGGLSQKVLGWIGLGYGDLGRSGPVNMTDEAAVATNIIFRDWMGHSTWFAPSEFDATMRLVSK